MGRGETSTDKRESWSHAPPNERTTAEPTDMLHQWYVRTYDPPAILSVGNNGPGAEAQSLEGLLLATDRHIGSMAKLNLYMQSGKETTLDVGTELRVSAKDEIACTTPGKFAALAGGGLELVAYGALGNGLAPAPFSPTLGGAEDGGIDSIPDVEQTRTQNAQAREQSAQQLKSQHDGHHNTMTVASGVFGAAELVLGSIFAFKAKNKLGAITGGLTSLAGAALLVHSYIQDHESTKQGLGLIGIDGAKEVKLYGGEQVNVLGGHYAKIEACLRVFIESAGMVSAAATIFSAFGAVNAEMMGGITAGLLAGVDAEVNAGRDLVLEAQKGSVLLETKGHNKGIDIMAEHGSHVNVEADGEMKLESKKEMHVESEEAIHVKAKKTIALHTEEGDNAVHITAEGGTVTVVGKVVQVHGEEEVSLLVGSAGLTVKSGSVVLKDGSGSHKFSGGKLDSVTSAALASAKKAFKSAISKLNQQMGQLKDRVNRERAALRAKKTGKA